MLDAKLMLAGRDAVDPEAAVGIDHSYQLGGVHAHPCTPHRAQANAVVYRAHDGGPTGRFSGLLSCQLHDTGSQDQWDDG